jgi:hypothetical protein
MLRQFKGVCRNWRQDVSNAAKNFVLSKPSLAANRPTGSAADRNEPTDAQKIEEWRQAMAERRGDTFLLCLKHLEGKDVGVRASASTMDPGVQQLPRVAA